MNYADAFKIGSKCDGYIKCTYAKLHNTDMGAVFSLQAGYFYQNKARVDFNNSIGASPAEQNTDASGYITVDLPIVKAAEHIEINKPNEYVPVKLTQFAIDNITSLLLWDGKVNGRIPEKPTVTKYLVYKIWIVDRYEGGNKNAYGDMYGGKQHHVGDRELAMETYNPEELKSWEQYSRNNSTEYYYTRGGRRGGGKASSWTEEAKKRGWYAEVEKQMVRNPRTDELISAIQEDRTFYVKACAIDWIPTNADAYIKDPNGQMVKLADQLEAARKRMETAKAILATAATLTII